MAMFIREWRKNVYRVRDSDSVFFKSYEWTFLREQCFARDNYQCRVTECKNATSKNLNAHHIIPRHYGGADSLDNLITLCSYHHDMVEEQVDSYNTVQLIEAIEDKMLRKARLPIITRECPEHHGLICWHMVVYGGIAKEFLGMKTRRDDSDKSDISDEDG